MPIPPIKIIISGIDKFSQVLAGASKSISSFGTKTAALGKKMTTSLTLPIAAFGALSVREFSTYEESLARVQALTGASTEQMGTLGEMTKQIGSSSRYSATQAADGLKLLTQAGVKLNDSMKVLPGVLQLSTNAQVDMNTAVETADMLSDAYNVNITDMARVNELMAAASLKGEMGVATLAAQLQNFAPVAQTLNMSLEETATVISAIGRSGLPVERSIKGLKTAMLSLQTPSKTAVDTFQKLGIKKSDLFDSQNRLRSFTEVIKVFEKTGAKTQDMLKIFGDSGGPVLANLLGQGSSSLEELNGQISNTSGLADRLTKTLGGTTKAKLDKFNASLKGLYIAFAENIIPTLTPLFNFLIRLMNGFGRLSGGMQKFIATTLLIVAAVGPALLIVGKLTVGVGALFGKVTSLWGVIKFLGMALFNFGKFLFTLNPVVLLIAAAIGIWSYNAYLLWKNWKAITEVFSDWSLLLGTIKYFLLDIGASLARLVLPKWLEKKLGLTPEDTGAGGAGSATPATATAATAGAGRSGTQKSEVKVWFDQVPKGTRIEGQGDNLTLDSYYGPALQGAH